jgi:hypothetical protein
MTDVGNCRSCGAGMIYASSTASGSTMVIDLEPSGQGNIRLTLTNGRYRAEVLGPRTAEEARAGGEQLHTSHHMTCPEGPAWRKRGRSR